MTQKTIEQWLNEWLEVYAKSRKENTYLCYKDTITRILRWKPDFKTRLVDDISEMEIQEFINVMADIYAKSTLNDMRVVFHQAYDAAVANRLCLKNPVGKIIIPAWANEKKVRALTFKEQQLVEEAAASDILGHMVMFFLNTGLRAGELRNLRWSDYDVVHSEISVIASKTEAGIRKIPLLPEAQKIIEAQPNFCDYIFTSTIHKQVTPTVLKKLYARMRKKTGLDFITNHVYPHSFATRLVENGVDYKALSALLGHTNVSFTMHRYVDAHNDFLREQINLLNKRRAS